MQRLITMGICLFLCAGSALATTYDLKGDFSDAANPNGVWSFTAGPTALTHFSQPGDGNQLNGAAGNGYWGTGVNFASAPFIFKTTQNGTQNPSYTDADFLVGDVIAHSANPGGQDFAINWTAPGPGTITGYSGSVWYAHSVVNRSNEFALSLNDGPSLESGTVTSANNRNNPLGFSSVVPMVVAAGDVLSLTLTPTAGQTFGSINGTNLTVDFTVLPEPGSALALLAGGTLLCRRRAGGR